MIEIYLGVYIKSKTPCELSWRGTAEYKTLASSTPVSALLWRELAYTCTSWASQKSTKYS